MRVGIEILTGRFFYADVEESATVGTLKREIATVDSALHEGRLILMLPSGRLMKDERRPLAEYGVLDGSIVYLFFTSPPIDPHWLAYFEDFFTTNRE